MKDESGKERKMIEQINLLKRWSELQPDENNPDDLAVTLESLDYTQGVLPGACDLSGVYPQILWKVQQAIEARGWPWTLWFDFDEHGASVFTDNGKYEYEAEVSAAEALLSAYVKALEAQGERSE